MPRTIQLAPRVINIIFQIGEGKIIMIKSEVFDEESRKVMTKELAIISGIIPDDDNKVDNLNEYFKKLGV